jgi:hypothetical protein
MSKASVSPRFVPTLTEVFKPDSSSMLAPGEDAMPTTLSPEQQDQMVRRVLTHMDLTLEKRLHEAVGQLILEHTETLVLRLREEIEQVVRQSVARALDQEAAQLPAQP